MDFLDAFIASGPALLKGLLVTVELTAVTLALSVVLGGIVAAMRLSTVPAFRIFATAYLAIIRGVPLIVLLFVIYFGIVSVIKVDAFTAAAVGLSIHTSAYVAEIFRTGIRAIHRGQIEAARSLGMSRVVTLQRVTAPQALRVVVPSLVNQAIISLKDSSVAAFITVNELFLTAQRLSAANFQPLTYYIIVSIYYLALVGLMSVIAHRVERYFATKG